MTQQFGGVPIKGIHGVRVVRNLFEMNDILTDGNWPSNGPKFLAALSALIEQRVGRCSPKQVRIAFISAAIEADVLPDAFMEN
ncbi:DUF982 domain-containing protein [Mesorhizobium qingshengii]|uniref:DUF982 domain-containing protein n=1 Tax=Mesorhizobium qingshengii TaxID=1165689 RepID=A0A1G5Z3E4_9HYPH|nr:DUF982 domain-containing protein [Mesorhizobium qingshengii]SDA89082.1 Protein of unknown function [Mesorhizobium qingshengii]